MEIVLANPRGFCAGVDRAIAIVNRALECFNPPIYVRHEVVHNKFVVDGLRRAGAVFVDELDEVPDPYYGGEAGFAQVLDLIEQACDALVLELKGRL